MILTLAAHSDDPRLYRDSGHSVANIWRCDMRCRFQQFEGMNCDAAASPWLPEQTVTLEARASFLCSNHDSSLMWSQHGYTVVGTQYLAYIQCVRESKTKPEVDSSNVLFGRYANYETFVPGRWSLEHRGFHHVD